MNEILNQAKEVADSIKKSADFKEYQRLEALIEKKYKNEIKDLKKYNEKYNDIVETGGKHHPDYNEFLKKFIDAKDSLYLKEEVKEYQRLDKIVKKQLDFISDEISKVILPETEIMKCTENKKW